MANKFVDSFRNYTGAGTTTRGKFFWTGHKLTNRGGKSLNAYTTSGYITFIPPTAWISARTGKTADDVVVKRDTSYILFHETAHQLGAYDHYCYYNNGQGKCTNPYCERCNGIPEENRTVDCTMVKTYKDDILIIENERLFCNECLKNISYHLGREH